MAYEAFFTSTFEREYDKALGYLVEDLKSPASAAKLMADTEKAVALLQENPELASVSSKPALGELALREWLVNKYTIVYRVEGERLYFVHFFHQRQDFERLI